MPENVSLKPVKKELVIPIFKKDLLAIDTSVVDVIYFPGR